MNQTPEFVKLTFILAGLDERDLGRARRRQVVGAAVRARGHTPLPGDAALALPVPAAAAATAAPPGGPAHAAVGGTVGPAAGAARLVDLLVVAVLLLVVLRHGLPFAEPAHGHVHLPLSPDCLKVRQDKRRNLTSVIDSLPEYRRTHISSQHVAREKKQAPVLVLGIALITFTGIHNITS